MKFKSHDFNPIDHVTYLPVPPPVITIQYTLVLLKKMYKIKIKKLKKI